MTSGTWRSVPLVGIKRGLAVGTALLVLGAASLAACSGPTKQKFNTVGSRIEGGESAATAQVALGNRTTPRAAAKLARPTVGSQVSAQRQVVYNGTISVRVADSSIATDQARRLAERAGGYLASETASSGPGHEVRATVRVPSASFDEVLAGLAKLGKVRSRTIKSDDVTAKVVDLDGRLRTTRISAERIRQLLAKATVVTDIVDLEDRLTSRETEIESMAGELEVLKDQVSFSTIDVALGEHIAVKAASVVEQ